METLGRVEDQLPRLDSGRQAKELLHFAELKISGVEDCQIDFMVNIIFKGLF